MKPVIFSVLAMLCYAISNVMLELKFSKYNNLTLIVCYGSVIFLSALCMRQITITDDKSFNFPVGLDLLLVIVMGLVFSAADYFFVGAYTNGGNLLTITSITVMFPVFASLIKFFITRSLPNVWQTGGYALAVIAIIFVTIGSQNSGK